MKGIKVRFEQDRSLDNAEVIVRAAEKTEELEALMERISGMPPDTLTVTDMDGALLKIRADDIVSISVMGRIVNIVTEGGSYTVRQSLQSLESELDDERFVRISRYELVNVDKIRRCDFTLSGTLRIELAGGMETWASRRSIPLIRNYLMGKE